MPDAKKEIIPWIIAAIIFGLLTFVVMTYVG